MRLCYHPQPQVRVTRYHDWIFIQEGKIGRFCTNYVILLVIQGKNNIFHFFSSLIFPQLCLHFSPFFSKKLAFPRLTQSVSEPFSLALDTRLSTAERGRGAGPERRDEESRSPMSGNCGLHFSWFRHRRAGYSFSPRPSFLYHSGLCILAKALGTKPVNMERRAGPSPGASAAI